MSVSAWVLTVILVVSDGGGSVVLLDRSTGQFPVFSTSEDCNAMLLDVTEGVDVGGNPEFDWDRSILRCEPKTD